MEAETTILILKSNNKKTIFKVTRRLPRLGTADTRFFDNKEKAMELYKSWGGKTKSMKP